MTQSLLLVRDPETLDGYTPVFDYTDVLFGYDVETTKGGYGLGSYMSEDEPRVSYHHSIFVDGQKYYFRGSSDVFSHADKIECATMIVNEYVKGGTCSAEFKQFINENNEQLNNDKRYWQAMLHKRKMMDVEREIELLQEQVRRARCILSVKAIEVKERRWIYGDERNVLLAEFYGSKFPTHMD